jgi:hypothetical protein
VALEHGLVPPEPRPVSCNIRFPWNIAQ